MLLKKNQIIDLAVSDLNNLGFGVGKYHGMTVFVYGAVDGDECKVKIIKANKNYCVGIITELICPSVHRSVSSCPSSEKCGGCAYQSIGYQHELGIKRDYVKSAFRKAGLSDIVVKDTVSNMKIEGYRNKAQYPIAFRDGEYILGFYASKTHRVITADRCSLQPSVFRIICEKMKKCFSHFEFSVYDEISKKGLLRHLYLRTSSDNKQIMACLVINAATTVRDVDLAEYVKVNIPEITTLLLNENRDETNVVLGDHYKLLFGTGDIKDTLCGVTLEISPAAFYQVNHDMTELLYRKAAELARLTGKEKVYDLYCGIGSIGLSMHEKASSIVGVDVERSAIECACKNAHEAGIANAHFYCADASNTDGLFEGVGIYGNLDNSVVIFDPPRKGSSEKLIRYVCGKDPLRVVYISCNPDTLARDAVCFTECGYIPSDVTPFDLFPRTGHVECVVCFEKN